MRYLSVLVAVFVMSVSFVCLASPVLSPQETVLRASVEVMEQVELRRDEFTANPQALFAFAQTQIDRLVDKERSARLALGTYARSASDAEIEAFGDALARNLAARYGTALLEFDGTIPMRVVSQSELGKGRGFKVSTVSRRRKGGEVEVDYFIREVDGQWRVFDVHIAGFSYAMTLKSMFVEDLRTKSITQVAEKLNRQTDRQLAREVKEAGKQQTASASR